MLVLFVKIKNIGYARNGFPSSNNLGEKSWATDDTHLYRNNQSTQSWSEIRQAQQYHLPNHFDFHDQDSKSNCTSPEFSSVSNQKAVSTESLSSTVLPGLGIFSSTLDTNNKNSSSSNSLNNLDILQPGLTRPASTGVIGNPRAMHSTSSVMESLGLGATHKKNSSKLDLIQEDFPKTPSPEYSLHEAKNNGSNSTSTSSLQYAAQRDSYHSQQSSTNASSHAHPVSSIQCSNHNHNQVEKSFTGQQKAKMMHNTRSSMNNFDANVSV